MKYFKKLVGDRIYLSPRNADDAEKYVEWLSDFDITDYLGRSSMVFDVNSEKEYLLKNDNEVKTFSIVELGTDKLLGNLSLERINTIHRSATMGIFIGDKDYLSHGYGTEAIRLLLDFGFNYLNLHSVNLTVLACNKRAIKCYTKVGFKETGRARDARFVNGKYYDIFYMDILESEFKDTFIKNKNI